MDVSYCGNRTAALSDVSMLAKSIGRNRQRVRELESQSTRSDTVKRLVPWPHDFNEQHNPGKVWGKPTFDEMDECFNLRIFGYPQIYQGECESQQKPRATRQKLVNDSDAERMHDWKTPESHKGGRQSQRVDVGKSSEEGLH